MFLEEESGQGELPAIFAEKKMTKRCQDEEVGG